MQQIGFKSGVKGSGW